MLQGSAIEGITFLPYLLTIPLSIYGIIWFRFKTKDEIYATKRSLFLSYGLKISLSFGILMTFCAHGTVFYISDDFTTALVSTVILLYLFSWYLILYFLIIKSWLLYYKYKFSFYTLQLEWQQLINSNIIQTSQKTNWYIHNNHKYGNLKYMTKRGAFVAFLGYIWFILYFINTEVPAVLAIGFFCTLLFIIFYIIILCKTPYKKDTYFFHWESRMHSRLLSLCFLMMVIMAMTFAIVPNPPYPYIFVGSIHIFISSVFCCMILVSTFCVVRKNTVIPVLRHTKSTDNNYKRYTVELLLSNKKSANAFMKYLAKEFSTFVIIC